MREETSNTTEINLSLRNLLPTHIHSSTSALSEILVGVIHGTISAQEAKEIVETNPNINQALQELSGNSIVTHGKIISFEEGGQFGDISIRDIAGGNITNVTFSITTPPTSQFQAILLITASLVVILLIFILLISRNNQIIPQEEAGNLSANVELSQDSALEITGISISDVITPTLDIKVRNTSRSTAFITTLILEIEKVWTFQGYIPEYLCSGYVDSSYTYLADLPVQEESNTISIKLSQSVDPNGVDRFSVALIPEIPIYNDDDFIFWVFLINAKIESNDSEITAFQEQILFATTRLPARDSTECPPRLTPRDTAQYSQFKTETRDFKGVLSSEILQMEESFTIWNR